MNYSIVFSSITGNTAAVAEKLRELLPTDQCTYFGEPGEEAVAADVIFAGFWTDKGSCDDKTRLFLKQLDKKTVILFGTAGFGSDEEYFSRVLKDAEQNIPVSNTVLPGFMCQGKMRPQVKERYEKMLEENPEDAHIRMLLDNFECASSHPDEGDFAKLEQWCHQFHL